MFNIGNGCCGSAVLGKESTIQTRQEEALASAEIAGAHLHPPLVDDGFILYSPTLLRETAAVVRRIRPDILLIPSPQDYMEDHETTCRLLTTAAFVREMPNFDTIPPVDPCRGEVVVYHSLPHGLRDGLRRLVRAGMYVDIEPVLELKRRMLNCHQSQASWLDSTQKMNSYVEEMVRQSASVGKMGGRFSYSEGWRRHSHLGFSPPGSDPLSELLGDSCWVDSEYELGLGKINC
jgi:LmbE family N-acetylglucosaminyl deacetylase